MNGLGWFVSGRNSFMAEDIHRVTPNHSRFCKLADTFGMTGLVAETASGLDDVISQMIETDGPVIADIRIEKEENCFQ